MRCWKSARLARTPVHRFGKKESASPARSTPSWYPEKLETGKVVPAWNYAVVHAYGHLKVIEDAGWLIDHLKSLTGVHEAAMPQSWKVSEAPADYIESLVKGIVGLELPIERFEGKWKVSRNQPERTRIGVAKGLERLNTPERLAMRLLWLLSISDFAGFAPGPLRLVNLLIRATAGSIQPKKPAC